MPTRSEPRLKGKWVPITLGTLLGLGAGCGPNTQLMPLAEGKQWTYLVRVGMTSHTIKVKVNRSIPVGGVAGWELTSPRGVTRLGWKDDRLLMDLSSKARFSPPMPILATREKSVVWQGWFETMGTRLPARCTLSMKPKTSITLGGRERRVTCSEVSLKVGEKWRYLTTWFEPGIGIVQQEHREGGRLKLSMQLLADR